MKCEYRALAHAALALSEAERARLVEQLLESLAPKEAGLSDHELFVELERRRAEVEQGSVKPIPWSEVRFEE
jgi:putative addiction module component (TIGR02574 family)